MILSIDNVQYFNECRPMYVCIIFYINKILQTKDYHNGK